MFPALRREQDQRASSSSSSSGAGTLHARIEALRAKQAATSRPTPEEPLPAGVSVRMAALENPYGRMLGTLPLSMLSPTVTLGRGDSVHVRLDDPCVHRLHAQIRWDEVAGTHVIEDLGGANGTWLNGERVVFPRRLQDGACIRLGRTEVTYRITTEAVRPMLKRVPAAHAINRPTLHLDHELPRLLD
jgi:pSer/pThr/pTyr-binding forkhead associated (FHA) protein